MTVTYVITSPIIQRGFQFSSFLIIGQTFWKESLQNFRAITCHTKCCLWGLSTHGQFPARLCTL